MKVTGLPFSYAQAADFAKNGSPLLLQAVGRVFGLGEEERAALGKGGVGVPWWFWTALGLSVGFVGGVRVYRRWPREVPVLIKGKR